MKGTAETPMRRSPVRVGSLVGPRPGYFAPFVAEKVTLLTGPRGKRIAHGGRGGGTWVMPVFKLRAL